MRKFNLKKHNRKMMDFAKKVSNGTYPSTRTAKAGSVVGIVLGLIVTIVGGVSLIVGKRWGLGSLFMGILAIISNIINIKRIAKQNTKCCKK